MSSELLNKIDIQSWQKMDHPTVDVGMMAEWQAIVDLMARIMDVPSSLIMHLEDDMLSVFIRSEKEGNPYFVGDAEKWFGSGLYCERVLRSNKKLFVPNALNSQEWKNNPDVKINMISYLGFPLKWPNGDPFGTICVLDNRTRYYTEEQEELLVRFKRIIEGHLEQVENYRRLNALTKKLEQLAYVDALTKILNRRAFFEQSDKEIHRARRYVHPLCIMMIDLDEFKSINDQYGHGIGDEVLKVFAAEAQELKRAEDVFGRVGGEEFAMLLPETTLKSARKFAERIRVRASELTINSNDHNISFTISIGLAENVELDEGLELLMGHADQALYIAKESGRNRVCFY